jgi:hypothetical protein
LHLHRRASPSYGTARAEEHKLQFRKHCHLLVDIGYKRIKSEDHSVSDEDWITQRIVEEAKAILRSPACPRWAERYSLRDQVVLSVPGRETIRRPKIDIEIESNTLNRPTYHFEAKRLRIDRTDSVSEYLGKGGLGSLLSERYARTSDEAGMLGYVQSGNPFDWAQDLAAKLNTAPMNLYCLVDNGAWIAYRVIASIENTFRTQHSRPNLGPITLFHRVLDVRSSSVDAE